MFPKTRAGTRYLVSLDNLDLVFLSQYVENSKDEKRLLWSKPLLEGESTYYEVELVSEIDSCDTSYIDTTTSTTICHICNMDVPVPYYQQHTESVMHKSYLRLTEKILKNVSKQLNIDIENINDSNEDKFFCETCCKVVPVQFKNKHIKSNYHVKCKENLRQIDIFLDIYTKDQQYPSETENKTEIEDLSSISVSNIDKTNIDLKYHESSDTDFSQYESSDEEKYRNNCKLSSVSKNSSNELDNKEKKQTSQEKETYCDVCNIYIQTHNFLAHTKGQKHKLNKRTRKTDENTVSTQSKTTSSQNCPRDSIVFCNICKVTVPKRGKEVHESGKAHIEKALKTLAQQNLAKPEPVKSLPKVGTTVPYVANTITPSTSKGTPVHMITKEKLKNFKKQIEVTSETVAKCLVCLVHIPNSDTSIVEHFQGRNHLNNVNIILNENKILQVTSNDYFCKLCDMNCNDFFKHVNEYVEHIKKKLMKCPLEKKELKKYIHDYPLDNSPLAIVYRDIYKDLLKQNSITPLNNCNMFYCFLCNLKLTRISEMDHMFGERHRICLSNNT